MMSLFTNTECHKKHSFQGSELEGTFVAMSRVNIQGLIDNYKGRTTVYTPLVEAVVNSIQAIEESGRKDGEVKITVKRAPQLEMKLESEGLPEIDAVEIEDNGVGFTEKNRESFDTVYSALKRDLGGKGFGRFTFHKYFKNISVISDYIENDVHRRRSFIFGKETAIIEDEKKEDLKGLEETKTTLSLSSLKDQKFDKELDTIARKLVEHLLIYFIREDYKCPKIILREEGKDADILLNDYVSGKDSQIRPVGSKSFELTKKLLKEDVTDKFEVKVFKIYYTRKQSSISLAADNREVTEAALHKYIPEFVDEFFEDYENAQGTKSQRNYTIKTYVIGKYLDEHVLPERGAFEFEKNEDLYSWFSQEEIEAKAAEITKSLFESEVQTRQEKKLRKVKDYVNTKAPWHKPYLAELNIKDFPYNLGEEGMELELQKVKFRRDQEARETTRQAVSNDKSNLSEAIEKLMGAISASSQSDLVHYVCNRKLMLELFYELLKRNHEGDAAYEKDLHNLIFPMGRDSTDTKEEDHNLWIMDERLVFSEFIASDKKIGKKAKGEPDLVVFNQRKSFRTGDNEPSNPLIIVEFKRPKREDYAAEDDPIKQMGDYLIDIRDGKYETPGGVEKVKVGDSTPVYGYLIADITPKVEYFAEKIHQLKKTPDGEGYFGLTGFGMVVTVMSYKKLLNDARMRNTAFFKILGIN